LDLDLRAIRSFVELADDLSFTRASVRLGITQPQLSLRINLFEQRLGFRLFERTSRAVQLSPQGSLLLEGARTILDNVDAFRQSAADIRFDFQTRLRIAVVDYFPSLRRQLLQSFMAKHPSVVVEIETVARSPDALTAVAAGQVDAAFMLCGDAQPISSAFDVLTLSRQSAGLLMRRDAAQLCDGHVDESRFSELVVALFRREHSPSLHDDIVDFFGSRVGKIVRLPEPTLEGVVHFAGQTGAAVACVKWWTAPADAPAGLDHYSVPGWNSDMTCMLVRPRAIRSTASNLLWQMAEFQFRQDATLQPGLR
jgi:DNA-binding transcriptional LysR family regulator